MSVTKVCWVKNGIHRPKCVCNSRRPDRSEADGSGRGADQAVQDAVQQHLLARPEQGEEERVFNSNSGLVRDTQPEISLESSRTH